jgi:hypothetical protein
MGTRGLFGFLYKGVYYMVYNHWDSYPEGLGRQLVAEIRQMLKEGRMDEWIELLKKIKVVVEEEYVVPTPEDIEKLAPYTDLEVSERSVKDWYCLTHKCQGSFLSVLKSGYLYSTLTREEMKTGPTWDLFVEYMYILDFDHNTLKFNDGEGEGEVFPLDHLPEW